MKRTTLLPAALIAGCAILPMAAKALVTAEEAAKLKTTLTPLGAERAGNKEGSIPPWTGGYTTPTETYQTANGTCRTYQTGVSANGQNQSGTGTACRQPDGTWAIVN